MSHLRRSLRAAAIPLAALAGLGSAAAAQEATNTVGSPVLKDFQLPGRRTTPPAETPPASTTPPERTAPTVERPTPAARPTQAPAATAPAARTETPRLTPAPAPVQPREEAAPAAELPSTAVAPAPQLPAEVVPPAAGLAPVQRPPQAEAPAPAPAPAPAEKEEQGSSWLPALAAGLVGLLLGAWLFVRLRRRKEEAEVEERRDAAREELGNVLFAEKPAAQPEWQRAAKPVKPAPPTVQPTPEPEVAAAAAAAAAREQHRAWLEIDIDTQTAAATDTEATIHYALHLRNRGADVAHNIRIVPRLFNAAAEAEVAAFLDGPIHEQSGSPQVTIAQEGRLTLKGQVSMPKSDMREIEVQGVRIFVPMVAINVAYDWGTDGAGRTSRSWLVGREPENASQKMGAFRLDLGPRIYRSVTKRDAKRVMV